MNLTHNGREYKVCLEKKAWVCKVFFYTDDDKPRLSSPIYVFDVTRSDVSLQLFWDSYITNTPLKDVRTHPIDVGTIGPDENIDVDHNNKADKLAELPTTLYFDIDEA